MIVLFPFVGFWLYLYLVFATSFLLVWAYKDEYTLCSLNMLVFLTLFSVTGKFDVLGTLHYVRDNPAIIVGGVAVYILIGTLWARLKWHLLLRKLKDRVDAEMKGMSPEKVWAEVPWSLRGDGFKMVNGKLKLDVDYYRSRIVGWLAYWHVSAVLWLVGDFLRDVFDSLYRMVRGHFQSAADSMFD